MKKISRYADPDTDPLWLSAQIDRWDRLTNKQRRDLMVNPSSPINDLVDVATMDDWGMAPLLLENPMWMFYQADMDQDIVSRVYECVAHVTSDVDFLSRLAMSSDERIRLGAFLNPLLPRSFMEEALASQDTSALDKLAANDGIPADIIRAYPPQITGRKTVRFWLSRNPRTPVEWLGTWLKDSFRGKTSSGEILSDSQCVSIRRNIAANPAASPTMLRMLARSNEDLDQLIATNPSTPLDVLELIARGWRDSSELAQKAIEARKQGVDRG